MKIAEKLGGLLIVVVSWILSAFVVGLALRPIVEAFKAGWGIWG